MPMDSRENIRPALVRRCSGYSALFHSVRILPECHGMAESFRFPSASNRYQGRPGFRFCAASRQKGMWRRYTQRAENSPFINQPWTFPIHCKSTENLLSQAIFYLNQHPSSAEDARDAWSSENGRKKCSLEDTCGAIAKSFFSKMNSDIESVWAGRSKPTPGYTLPCVAEGR